MNLEQMFQDSNFDTMAGKIAFDEMEMLEKAMCVFWEKGYHGTSVDDLVKAMGINRSSLYNTFGDKHELFLRSLRFYSDMMYRNIASLAKQADNPLESVFNIIDGGIQLAIGIMPSCLATKSIFELSTKDTEAFVILKNDGERIVTLLENLIEQAQKEGLINTSYDANLLAEYVYAQFSGWRRSCLLHADTELINQLGAMIKTNLKS